jgi:hypothetical protein
MARCGRDQPRRWATPVEETPAPRPPDRRLLDEKQLGDRLGLRFRDLRYVT